MTGDVNEKSEGRGDAGPRGTWMDGGGRLWIERADKKGIMRRYPAPCDRTAKVVKSRDGQTVYVRHESGRLERADERPRGKAAVKAAKKARRLARGRAAK